MKALLALGAVAALLVPWRHYAGVIAWMVSEHDPEASKRLRGSCIAVWDGRDHPHHILMEANRTLKRARNCVRDGNPFRLYGRRYMVTAIEQGATGWTMQIFGHELPS